MIAQNCYIDIHSHACQKDSQEVICIQQHCFLDAPFSDVLMENPSGRKNYSIGVHPWEADKMKASVQLQIPTKEKGQLLAIGETGLDKLRGPSFVIQSRIFLQQIELAETLKLPLLIHCVRYYNELLAIKEKSASAVPWIIHGFRGKAELADQLLKHGFYLSFGKAILTSVPTIKTLQTVPISRLFLETDDSDIGIDRIYEQAANILGTELEQLRRKIFANFRTVFNYC